MTHDGAAFEIDPMTLHAFSVDRAAMVRRAAELRGLCERSDSPIDAAHFASDAAILFVIARELDQAAPLFGFALARQSRDAHPRARMVTEIRLAQMHQFAGRLETARALLEDVVARCRTARSAGANTANLPSDSSACDRSPAAESNATEILAVGRLLDFALQHLAKVRFDQGDDAAALALFREALELRQAAGATGLVASTALAMAAVTRRLAERTAREGVRR